MNDMSKAMEDWSKPKFADNAGLLLRTILRQYDLNEIRSQWDRIRQINSSCPWPYRILCQYLGSKKKLEWDNE